MPSDETDSVSMTVEIWFRHDSDREWTLFDLPANRKQAEEAIAELKSVYTTRQFEIREVRKWINGDD